MEAHGVGDRRVVVHGSRMEHASGWREGEWPLQHIMQHAMTTLVLQTLYVGSHDRFIQLGGRCVQLLDMPHRVWRSGCLAYCMERGGAVSRHAACVGEVSCRGMASRVEKERATA
eukprot:192721-Chlamydomonas_euryale.AAC.5